VDVQQQNSDNVTFIGVPGSTDLESVRSFIDGTGSTNLVHLTDTTLWEDFDVARRQTYVLVDASGNVERVDFNNLSSRIGELAS